VRAALRRARATTLAVGDEFSPGDRAALHAARAAGVATRSRQHGVIDGHYLRDGVLAVVHLVWDEATRAWMSARAHVDASRVRVLPRPRLAAPAGPRPSGDVVFFAQPYEMGLLPGSDLLAETLPPAAAAAREAGRVLWVKPHPLQTPAAIREALPPACAKEVRIASGRSAARLLERAAVAITLDSSVVVDCRDCGVPCLSPAWYAGHYVADLVRLGYLVACPTPEALGAAVRDRLRAAAR
jgi:hypothetical protein